MKENVVAKASPAPSKLHLKTGLGLRRELVPFLFEKHPPIDFLELAPENWMQLGGKFAKEFKKIAEVYPLVCHGLSLSLGSPAPLDVSFLKRIKKFLDTHSIPYYSEHLSYCSDSGHLYDLLPIPFTESALRYTAKRIRQAQEILERKIAIENVSYYLTPPLSEMSELEFVLRILEEANCRLLLDVNNIYVNSVNHGYDAKGFLEKLPVERIAYVHVAGHYQESKNLIIDTHGADIVNPVWKLLKECYKRFGPLPTLLERDFNIPPFKTLLREVKTIRKIQGSYSS